MPFNLTLDIFEARNLISADRNGLSDPYVVVYLGGQKVAKNKKIRKTLNPKWNSKFIVHPAGEHDVLLIEVWDWDRITSDDELGNVTIKLDDIIRYQQLDAWYHLEGVPHGEIKIGLNTSDFGALEGEVMQPGSLSAFPEDYTIFLRDTHFPLSVGKESIDLSKLVGKYVRLRGRTVPCKTKDGKIYSQLVVGGFDIL